MLIGLLRSFEDSVRKVFFKRPQLVWFGSPVIARGERGVGLEAWPFSCVQEDA